jgi:WD40 repeat protein
MSTTTFGGSSPSSMTSKAAPFDTFISYRSSSSRQYAKNISKALFALSKRHLQDRSLRIFLDTSALAAGNLDDNITQALDRSRTLVVCLDKTTVKSAWVAEEIEYWLAHGGSSSRLFLARADEIDLRWNHSAQKFASEQFLPEPLRDAFSEEQKYFDVPTGRTIEASSLAGLYAAIMEMDATDLLVDEADYQRRRRRRSRAVITALAVLLVLAVVAGVVAVNQRNAAQRQTLVATSRQLVAESTAIRDGQPGLARQLLAQAYRLAPTDQVLGGLIESASMPRVIAAPDSEAVEISPRRGLIAMISKPGVSIYEPGSTKRIATLENSAPSTWALAFSQDDRLLAVGDQRKVVQVFDVSTPKKPVLRSTVALSDAGTAVAFLGGSSTLLAVGVGNAGFELWDIADEAAPRRLAAVHRDTLDLAVSPDGNTLATAADAITLWDINNPRAPIERATLKGHEAQVTTLDFDPRGRWLASGGWDDTARLWNVTNPSKPTAGGVFSGQSIHVEAVEFSPDGETLAVGAGDTTIHLWEVADPLRPRQGAVLTGHTGAVKDLSFDPQGHTLASVGTDGATSGGWGENGTVRLWPVVGASRSDALTGLPAGSSTAPTFSSDGRLLATGLPTTLWSLANPANPQRLSQVTTFNAGGQATALSPDGRLLASGDPLVLWDVTDPTQPRSITPDVVQDEGAMLVAFSPNSSTVLTAAGTGFRLWDIAGGHPTLAATLPGAATEQGAAFAPNGKIVATRTDDGRTQLWNVSKPNQPRALSTLPVEAGTVESVAFASDTLIVTGSTTGLVSLWDVHDPAKPSALSTIARHTGNVAGLAVQSKASLLASASDDGTIRLTAIRDPARPVEITALHGGGTADPAALAFSPDGGTLAAASANTFALWSVDVSAILKRLCADSETITQADWNRYLPGFPYDPPCA